MIERLRPALAWIFAPVAEEPMKPIASMPGCVIRASPVAPSPGRIFTRPSGNPASRITSIAASTVNAVCVGGLTIWALPVARLPGSGDVVVREQRASADPALDTIHPGDRIALSWDESSPLLLGEAVPATTDGEQEES